MGSTIPRGGSELCKSEETVEHNHVNKDIKCIHSLFLLLWVCPSVSSPYYSVFPAVIDFYGRFTPFLQMKSLIFKVAFFSQREIKLTLFLKYCLLSWTSCTIASSKLYSWNFLPQEQCVLITDFTLMLSWSHFLSWSFQNTPGFFETICSLCQHICSSESLLSHGYHRKPEYIHQPPSLHFRFCLCLHLCGSVFRCVPYFSIPNVSICLVLSNTSFCLMSSMQRFL